MASINMFNWFLPQETAEEEIVKRKIESFFITLNMKGDHHRAMLDAAVWFEEKALSQVIYLLQSQYQCSINQQDEQGNSALHIVAYDIKKNLADVYKKLQSLYCLLEVGINPNVQNKQGDTVLHILARHVSSSYINEYLDCIRYFVIQKKADLKIKNQFGNTAFHEFVQYSDDLMSFNQNNQHNTNPVQFFIKLTIDSGCFLALKRTKNIDGNSLLHIAAIHGQPKTVKCLLEAGWDVNARNTQGVTPLHYAVLGVSESYIDVVDQLLAKESININIRIKDRGKDLDYMPADIVEFIWRYVSLTNPASIHTCAMIYVKFSKADNSTVHLYDSPICDSPIEDVRQELKKLGESLYYTGSQIEHDPQLYIALNTRANTIEACSEHIENAEKTKSHRRGFSETIANAILWGKSL